MLLLHNFIIKMLRQQNVGSLLYTENLGLYTRNNSSESKSIKQYCKQFE